MAPFDELQVLWQSQSTPLPPRFDAAAVTNEFRRYGRRQDIINIFKSILLAGALIQVLSVARHRPLFLFAFSVILFSGVLALIAEWRNQRAIASFDFTAPSIPFVRDTLARLHQQRNPLRTREFTILFGAIFIGYNLLVINSYSKWTVPQRILGHTIATVFPVIIYFFARQVRAHRWNKECAPLVERLTLLLDTLGEERVQ